jgi:hypothetical protein
MRPDRPAEGAAPPVEPATEASIPTIGRATTGPARTSPRFAGDMAGVPERAGRLTYEDWLRSELAPVIDQLELSDLQKRCLRARWLDAVLWLEGKAKQAQRLYYGLRLVIIIGGVIIPALVSIDLGSDRAGSLVRGTTFGLSLLVAISAAVEGFFRYGERWRHYRLTVERLKIEGWQFLQLSGPYARQRSHGSAYPEFAAQVEEILRSDVQQYITEIVREKPAPAEQADARAGPAQPLKPSS